MSHFSEWWDQFVEEAIIEGDYPSYRQVMFLIGSLFRRLGATAPDLRRDELRERYMWTRMKRHLRDRSIEPRDALYICGAAHSASRVPEFGAESPNLWEIPPPSETTWLYGLIPSSYGAICHQFSHPQGAVTLDEARWRKSLTRQNLRPFSLKSRRKKDADKDDKSGIDPPERPRSKRKDDRAQPVTAPSAENPPATGTADGLP